jgi:electron transfer flavoprotein beta subunit
MNIIVCLKQVPGTNEVKINPQNNTLIRQGIKNVINPFDTYALEEGVRLKEKWGGRVTVISMGPLQATEMLKEAISLGADEGILLSDAAFAGADTWATALTLAAAVKKLSLVDLVICGRQSSDGDTAQVGPEMAEILNLPFVAYASHIEAVEGPQMRIKRLVEDGYEIIRTPLPAVITVTKEINRPRLPSLRGLIKAKSANIQKWGAAETGLEAARVGLNGSFTRVIDIFIPKREKKARMFDGEIVEQVDNLIARLKEEHLVEGDARSGT